MKNEKFIFIKKKQRFAFGYEENGKNFYYPDTLLPPGITTDNRNICLILLIKMYIKNQSDSIKSAINFLNPTMQEWDHSHFVNFLGCPNFTDDNEATLETTDYSSDSDDDDRDAKNYANTALEDKILKSHGNYSAENLQTRLTWQIDNNTKKGRYMDTLENAADRRAYFPENPFNSKNTPEEFKQIQEDIQKDLQLINSTVASDSKSKLKYNKDKKRYVVVQNENTDKKSERELEYNYYLPLFRGISYLTDRWGAVSRKKHRTLSLEQDLINYSEAIVRQMDANYYQLSGYDDIDFITLHKNARTLKEQLINCKISEEFILKDANIERQFDNFLDCLQYCFSNGIVNFLKFLDEFNTQFPNILPNSFNPFVPFSHLPFHAVKYAFGEKNPYRDFAIPPLWDKKGRARKPHIGKFYISIHPLSDFSKIDEPNVVPHLSQTAGVTPKFNIGPEYEVSFLSFTQKERLFKLHRIRYPSFHKPHRNKMIGKYGLSAPLYTAFQTCICSDDYTIQQAATELLKNWLCLFNAIKAMYEAQSEIQKRNGVCIFRHPNGEFYLNYPSEKFVSNPDENNRRKERAKHSNKESFMRTLVWGRRTIYRVSDPQSLETPPRHPLSHDSPRRKSLPLQNTSSSYTTASSRTSLDNAELDELGNNLFKINLNDLFYDDEKITRLMQQYFLGNADIYLFPPILGTNWNNQNHLRDQLIVYQAERANQIARGETPPSNILIPVNIYQNHWVLLNIRYQENTELLQNIYYFDPLGNTIPDDLFQALKERELFPNLEVIVENRGHILQQDSYNCGPWIIAIADFWINEGRMPEINEVNIEQKRNEHEESLKLIHLTQRNL